jgi:hypothetical protein
MSDETVWKRALLKQLQCGNTGIGNKRKIKMRYGGNGDGYDLEFSERGAYRNGAAG